MPFHIFNQALQYCQSQIFAAACFLGATVGVEYSRFQFSLDVRAVIGD
jgi:hypothetical protein